MNEADEGNEVAYIIQKYQSFRFIKFRVDRFSYFKSHCFAVYDNNSLDFFFLKKGFNYCPKNFSLGDKAYPMCAMVFMSITKESSLSKVSVTYL